MGNEIINARTELKFTCAFSMPGTALLALHVLTHLIVTKPPTRQASPSASGFSWETVTGGVSSPERGTCICLLTFFLRESALLSSLKSTFSSKTLQEKVLALTVELLGRGNKLR